jgi:ABC-type sugar transport system ATPase subunit
MTLCNRVLIMKRGVITAEFLTSEINEKALADEMTGVAKQ